MHVDDPVAGDDLVDVFVGGVGHEHPGAGGEATRAYADLHRIGAVGDEGPHGFAGGDVAGDDFDVPAGFDLFHGVEHAPAVAVGGVDHQSVDAGGDQRLAPVHDIGADADGGAHPEAAPFVLGGQREVVALGDVLDGDEAAELAVVVDDGQLLDAVLPQDLLGLVERGAHLAGDQRWPAHYGADGLVVVVDEAQVSVGEQTDQSSVVVDDGDARDLVLGHQFEGVVDVAVGGEGDRVLDHPRLRALHPVDLDRLVLDGQVAVDDAHAAGAGQGDGEPGLGDGVHRGRQDGHGETDVGREP